MSMDMGVAGKKTSGQIHHGAGAVEHPSYKGSLSLQQFSECLFPKIHDSPEALLECADFAKKQIPALGGIISSLMRRRDIELEAMINVALKPKTEALDIIHSYASLIQVLGRVYCQHAPSEVLVCHEHHEDSTQRWQGISEMAFYELQERGAELDLHGAYVAGRQSSKSLESLFSGVDRFVTCYGISAKIDLRGCRFSNADFAALCAQIERGNIEVLNLSNCHLDDSNAALLAATSAKTDKLITLSLVKNNISQDGATAIAGSFRGRDGVELDLRENIGLDQSTLDPIMGGFSVVHT